MKSFPPAFLLLLLVPAPALALESVPGQGGMLDINVTLVIQMVNYLVFIAIMDRVFYQPMLAHLDRQGGRIQEAEVAARAARSETEAVETERKGRLAAVYRTEHEARARAKAKALEEYQRVVSVARADSDNELQVARESAKGAARELERDLEGRVGELATLMADAVVRTGPAKPTGKAS